MAVTYAYSFIFRGLAHLVDHIFITSARSIKMVNSAGVKKIKRDILSLQQGLRNISASPGEASTEGILVRSMTYWNLYERGPKVGQVIGECAVLTNDRKCSRS